MTSISGIGRAKELKVIKNWVKAPKNLTWGGFQKSWVHGQKCKTYPNLGENAISWA
jgi:hypothetical protein